MVSPDHDALAAGIMAKNGGKAEGDVALITSLAGVGSLDARAKGFKTLAEDGIRLVRAGVTSVDELMRVADLTDRMA